MNLKSTLSKRLSGSALGGFAMVTILVGGCAQTPVLDMSPGAEVTFDGLHEIKHATAHKAWAKPGIDLSGYTKIMLQGAGIEYRPGGETRRRPVRSSSNEFALSEEQKAGFREIVAEVFISELGKSEKFTLVNAPAADALIVRGALLDVVSYVPPEPIGRGDVYLSEVGAVTLVLEIRDSTTDAIYVRAIDRDAIGDDGMMQQSNRPMNRSEVRQTIRRWASLLRRRLDSFSDYANPAE